MKIFLLTAFVATLALTHAGRVKRAALNNCITNPSEMDPRVEVVDDGDTMSMSCSSDGIVQACFWRHTDPVSEQSQGSMANPTIDCTGTKESSGEKCQMDTRVTFRNSQNMCGIDVSNTKPEDTGVWILTAMVSNANGQGTTNQEHRFTVYTFNESLVQMVDEDLQYENQIDTTYNWDTKEEEWMEGKGGYERIEFSCMAYGGRPEPVFEWHINNENEDLENVDHFNIRTSPFGGGVSDYIQNYQSTIEFQVDEKLLEKLQDYGIDVNPSNGQFDFEVTCDVTQGNRQVSSSRGGNTMRINVRRNHDDGQLKGSMIGVIVGVVLAGILIIIAVALLVFAKATSRWCFSDEYDHPSNARSHPNARAGGGNQQAQVYRDDEKKSNATRKSSTSSNNTTPLKTSAPSASNSLKKNGEWLPDSRKSAHSNMTPNLNTTPKQTMKSAAAAAASTTPKDTERYTGLRRPVGSPSSSSDSSSTSNNNNLPPPRPPKDGLQYANLDHRAFMNDPRNRVLPGSSSLPPGNTTYATVTTKEVTQTSSRTFGGSSKINREM